jgi:hypothetical protein
MDALIDQVLEGVDLSDPNAVWVVFWRMMDMVDWWLLIAVTVIGIVGGGLIGWRRGTFWRDVALGAALGPLGWIVSFVLPARVRVCLACGHRNAARDAVCRRCGDALPPVR